MKKHRNLSRRVLLTGTAVSALLVGPVLAAPVVIHSTTDVTVNQTAATGAPTAVDLSAGTAAIDVKVDTVDATATAGDTGSVVTATTGGAGTVKVQVGTLTATGEGNLIGINATSGDGAIDVQVDTLDVAGNNTAGVVAASTNGDIHISAQNAVVRGVNYDSLGGRDAVNGISTTGAVAIEGGHVEASGQYGSGVVALAGTTATVKVDEAVSHGDLAASVYVKGLTGASLDAGTVTATGNAAAAINAFSDQGNVTVTADSVTAGPGGYASLVRGLGNVSVTLGDSSSDKYGLTATSTGGGNVNVTLTGDLVSHQDAGINATGQTVNVTMGDNASITAATSGIIANGAAGATVVANDVDAQAQAVRISTTSGPLSLTVTGDVVSHNLNALSLTANGGEITIAEGATVTSYGGSASVAMGGRDSNIRLTNAGTIAAKGTTGGGIGFTTAGDIDIDSHLVTIDSTTPAGTGFVSAGMGLVSNGGGSITVKSDTVTVSGANRHGIYATTINDGGIDITAANTSDASDGFAAIRTISQAGDINISAGTVSASGIGNAVILANSTDGDVTVSADNVTTTGESHITGGLYSEGVMAQSQNGRADVTVKSGSVKGYASGVATALGGAGASVHVDNATVGGQLAAALYAGSLHGDASATAGTVTLTGDSQVAIQAIADAGKASVVSGTIKGEGTLGSGIYAEAGQAITVDSGTVNVQRRGIYANGLNTADVSIITHGDTVAQTAEGIKAMGGHVSVITDAGTLTSGTTGIAVTATGAAEIAVSGNVKSLQYAGIDATGQTVNVTMGENAAITAATSGIIANGVAGATVVANDVDAQGQAVRISTTSGPLSLTVTGDVVSHTLNAISLSANGGEITIAEGATVTSYGGSASVAMGGRDGNIRLTNAGTIAAKGTTGGGIGFTTAGDIDIDSHLVTIDSTTPAATGFVSGGMGLVSNGHGSIRVNSDTVIVSGANRHGIYAMTSNGAVSVTSGHISVDGGIGIYAVANGDVTIDSGAITASGSAISASSTGVNAIHVTGAVASSGSDAAIVASGKTNIINDGAISAASGTAVLLNGAMNDSFTMKTGSTVSGVVDMGGGDDTVIAAGTGAGEVAHFNNAEHLSIDSGQWHADKAPSFFSDVAIASGAELTVAQNAGDLAIQTGTIVLDGRLNLDLDTDTEAGDLAALSITGAGQVHLQGAATVSFDDVAGIQHTGGTFVENGRLLLTGNYGGNIQTSGDGVFQLGNGAATGSFTGDLVNNGTFVFDRSDNYSFSGDFSGTGLFEKNGAGTLTFAGFYDFTGTTHITAGTIALAGGLSDTIELDLGGGTIDLSQNTSGEQTIAALSGDTGTLNLGSTDLTVDQSSNTVFSGSLSGDSTLTKAGDGDLKLNGDGSNFTGDVLINGGILSVNGAFSGADVTVNDGAKLGGNGTVGDTTIDGGTIGAGNSIGHLTVNGDLSLTTASTLEVEVDNAGHADLVDVTGAATLSDASVKVLAAAGRYKGKTDYTILTAAGGISGHFGSVTSNFAFLTPTLTYGSNAVTLTLTRNDVAFADFGRTDNEKAVGNLLQREGGGNTLFEETLLLADTEVSPNFVSLTGEVWATLSSAMIDTSQMLRAQTDVRPGAAEGSWLWGTVLGSTGRAKSNEGAQNLDLDHSGLAAGFGWSHEGLDYSVGAGTLTTRGREAARITGDTTFVTGRISWTGQNGWTAQGGVQYGKIDDTITRDTRLGSLGGEVSGKAKGNVSQAWAELGRAFPIDGAIVTPFAGLSRVSATFDKASETGAVTALTIDPGTQEVSFSEMGVRLEGDSAARAIQPRLALSWRHAWGDRTPFMTAAFNGSPETMNVKGIGIAPDTTVFGAGLRFTRKNMIWDIGYDASISDSFQTHSAKASLMIRF